MANWENTQEENLNFVNVFSLFRDMWIPITYGCFVPSLIKIRTVVLEKHFYFKFRKCIFVISWLSPLGKGSGPSVEQIWCPFHKRMIFKFGWNWPYGSWRRTFLISSMYFCCFVITCPCKRTGPFTWTILNSLYPSMHCAKFDWNWPCGSGGEIF